MIDGERARQRAKYGHYRSPHEGTTFRSRIGAIRVNGALARDGRGLVSGPKGLRLAFGR